MNTKPTSRRRGIAAAALATAGVLVALSVPTAAVAAEGDTTIDIYDVNDFHGRIAQSISTPAPRAGDAAGAAVLAGALDQLRGDDPSTSAFVSAGDNIGASTFESFIQQDQPTIDVLNQMDLSVSAIGNHELDRGRADLQDRVIGPDDARNAQWDYVSANVLDATTGPARVRPVLDPGDQRQARRVHRRDRRPDRAGQPRRHLDAPDGGHHHLGQRGRRRPAGRGRVERRGRRAGAARARRCRDRRRGATSTTTPRSRRPCTA